MGSCYSGVDSHLHKAIQDHDLKQVKSLMRWSRFSRDVQTGENPLIFVLQNIVYCEGLDNQGTAICQIDMLEVNAAILDVLLSHGASFPGDEPMIKSFLSTTYYHMPYWYVSEMFYPDHLEVLFYHGMDLDISLVTSNGWSVQRTPSCCVDLALGYHSSVNTIRWLVRHGCSATNHIPSSAFSGHFIANRHLKQFNTDVALCLISNKLPMLNYLLQIGYRTFSGMAEYLELLGEQLAKFLPNLDRIVAVQSRYYTNMQDLERGVTNMSADRQKHAQFEKQGSRRGKKEATPSKHEQAKHIEEFSDETLHIYPLSREPIEVLEFWRLGNKDALWAEAGNLVINMQELLRQPRSLMLSARICLRECLLSLSPTIVRTLPVPAQLKRYILCHET